MDGFWNAVGRIRLWMAFVVIFAAHLLLYYVLGTDNWVMLALTAALTETALLAAFQLYAGFRSRRKTR